MTSCTDVSAKEKGAVGAIRVIVVCIKVFILKQMAVFTDHAIVWLGVINSYCFLQKLIDEPRVASNRERRSVFKNLNFSLLCPVGARFKWFAIIILRETLIKLSAFHRSLS